MLYTSDLIILKQYSLCLTWVWMYLIRVRRAAFLVCVAHKLTDNYFRFRICIDYCFRYILSEFVWNWYHCADQIRERRIWTPPNSLPNYDHNHDILEKNKQMGGSNMINIYVCICWWSLLVHYFLFVIYFYLNSFYAYFLPSLQYPIGVVLNLGILIIKKTNKNIWCTPERTAITHTKAYEYIFNYRHPGMSRG